MSQPPLQDATVHTVLCWRADSLTLFKLRPFLQEFIYLVDKQRCENKELGADLTCREEDYALGDMCFACRYKILREQLGTEPTEGEPA